MSHPKLLTVSLAAAVVAVLSTPVRAATTPVAEYAFQGSLVSSVLGAPALTVTDPLGLSGFGTDTVFGTQRTVYNFVGNATPSQQAGLSLGTAGLLTSSSVYTIEMQFKFTQNVGGWRRILDVQNRQSDAGFYVDPSNNLDVYPVAGGSAFTNNVYHDVFLTDNNGTVSFYLDGSAQQTISTAVMNVDSNNLMNFFLDNVVGGGIGEYSSGSIAAIRLYNVALDGTQIPVTPVVPVVPVLPAIPEPETWGLLLAGLGALGIASRRRASSAA